MTTKRNPFHLLLVIALTFAFICSAIPAQGVIPVTGSDPEKLAIVENLPDLQAFAQQVTNGWAGAVTGVYVPNMVALPVVQQPSNNAGFVSTQSDTLTQFSLAAQYGTIGLLAHDYLAGAYFSSFQVGQIFAAVHGDGAIQYYQVYNIRRFQALSPLSPYSNFIDLADNTYYDSTGLFYSVYGSGAPLVFQTCISRDGISSWGRLFVFATPIEYTDTLSLTKTTFKAFYHIARGFISTIAA